MQLPPLPIKASSDSYPMKEWWHRVSQILAQGEQPYLSKAGAPATTDITVGNARLVLNTSTGVIQWWANIAGVITLVT